MLKLRLCAGLVAGLCLSSALFAHDGDPKLLDRQPAHKGPGWRNAQRLGPEGNLALGGPGVEFAASNVTLLAWLSLDDFGVNGVDNANSCFGYVAPSGREYAIIGLFTGTAFVEITQPGNPVVVAHVNGPQSLWRDVKVFQHYCYSVSEGGGGIQVISMANIDAGQVTLVNTINDDATSATHTVALNPQSGYLYRSGGGSNGLRIYNLNANPVAPQRVGTWSDRYVHEPSVFTYTSGPAAGREIAYCCGGFNGGQTSTGLYVVDVTNKASPSLLKYISYPNSAYAHQVWPSEDRQWLYLNDELDDGNGITCRTRIFNNSNPLDVTYTGFFTNGETSVDHNLYTRGNRIYEANYRTGLRVFSTSNPGTPTAPVEIAWFDTWPEDDQASFNGLWNNYPYFPSQVVIGSDIEKGLFVWWVGTPPIVLALPAGAPATIAPGGDSVAVEIDEASAGELQAGTAKLHYSTGAGFVAVDLVSQGGNDWTANFPATPCGLTISWYLSGQSANGIIWSEPAGAPANVYTSTSASGLTAVFTDNFQTNQSWVATVSGATAGGWQRGVPVNDGSWDYDPVSDSDGSGQCYLTQNASGNTDVDGGSVTLTSPTINMAGGAIKISYDYYLYLTVADGTDKLLVQINTTNGTGTWTTIATHDTNGATSWRHHEIGSTALAALGVTPSATTKVRFTANDTGAGSIVEAGVDAFRVESVVCSSPIVAYCFGDGSLATACPCGNTGASGRGCENSIATGGALLAATGDVSPDTVVITSSGELATATSIFLQGNASNAAGTVFGDGVRCVAGSLKRLYVKNAVGGAVSAPTGGDASVSARSAALGDPIAPGSTRWYQVYYRDPDLGFCPSGDSYNVSNGLAITW